MSRSARTIRWMPLLRTKQAHPKNYLQFFTPFVLVTDGHCQPLLIALWRANAVCLALVPPHRRPRRRRCIEKVVFPESRRSAQQMMLDFWEDRAQNTKPLNHARFALLPVHQRALFIQRPEADLGVNLECPLLKEKTASRSPQQ